MAGFSTMYVLGRPGGFGGADGVGSIEGFILVGDASRQWLEPHYMDGTVCALGQLRVIVPAGSNHPDALLDACLGFFPDHFRSCPSLPAVEAELGQLDRLDFHLAPDEVPGTWATLREEARPLFAAMDIWKAELVPLATTV